MNRLRHVEVRRLSLGPPEDSGDKGERTRNDGDAVHAEAVAVTVHVGGSKDGKA